jgi:hypothetical protein
MNGRRVHAITGREVFLEDSGFCDLQRMEEYTDRGNRFLIRRDPKVSFHPDSQRPRQSGIDSQGRAFFEFVRVYTAISHRARLLERVPTRSVIASDAPFAV